MRSIGKWENTFARVHTKYKSLMVCEVLTRFLINQYLFYIGEVSEWSNVLDLKSSVLNGTGGSNPSFSAKRYSEAVIDDGVKMMKKGL